MPGDPNETHFEAGAPQTSSPNGVDSAVGTARPQDEDSDGA